MDYAKNIVIDFDGVLTDGTVYYTQSGERFKGIHSRDIRAIRELVAHGYDVTILTASSWPGSKDFADRCGVDVIVMRDKSEYKPQGRFIAVVDDISDIALVNGAHGCFAPSDCDKGIIDGNAVRVLETKGGHGVIAEFVRIIKELHSWTS